jgi:hypothetical protein
MGPPPGASPQMRMTAADFPTFGKVRLDLTKALRNTALAMITNTAQRTA